MDVTDYRNELARKSLEKIEHLCDQYNTRKITPLMFRTGVNAIWWIVCGLVDKETQAVIDAANAEIEELIRNEGKK